MKKNKYTIVVLALAAYTLILAVWGYSKGTASGTTVLCTVGGMAVLLCVLWFVLRKKAELQNRRKFPDGSEKEEQRK